ncbi:MAG: hypothetical protein ACXW1W_16165 [Methylococcaceae bacterium]
MKKIKMSVLLTTVLLLAGCACASTEYKAFEGKLDGIIDGNGGAKVIVNGMEIWDDGEPPRKFKTLGFIDDNREGGRNTMSILREDVVKKAREAGGDAVIKLNSQSQLAKFYAAGGASTNTYDYSAYAYGSSRTMPNHRNVSKYAVIKYVK